MATVLGLNVKFAANTAGISKGAERTAKQLRNIEKSSERATSALRGLVAIEVGKLLAGGLRSATSAISSFISDIRATVDETAKLAAQTGIAVEALQVFQLAAKMSGVDNLVEPIRKLGIEIGNAAQSGNIEKFERLGLNFDQLSRMAPEEQFKQIAAAIAALPTPAERAAAAVAIFGEQGVKMLPLFEQNLAAIEERMQRLGLVLTEDQTGAIEEMNDALLLVYKTFEGIIAQVTANLAPVVTELSEMFLGMVEGYEAVNGTGGTAIADSITDALFDGADYVADLLDSAIAQLNDWGVNIENTFSGLESTFQFFVDAVTFLNDAFYFVRSTFNDFLASFAEVTSKFVAYFSSAGAEFLDAFAENLRASAAQDRERISGPERAAQQRQDEGFFRRTTRTARESRDASRSPEAKAAREEKRRQEQEARDAAQKEAERLRKEEQRRKEEQKMIDDYNKQVLDAESKALEASLKYEQQRVEGLAAVNQKALEASDIRSGGISQVLAMATGREDPAVTEARKQLKELQAMRAELAALKALPVEIMGAA